jgi:hypothetical protein
MLRSFLAASLFLSFGAAGVQAGPCTNEILQIEKAVNEPNSPYTPTLPQSIGAQIDQQPTPSSVARAQQEANAHYEAVLDRARKLDSQNNSECEKVVRELKDLVGL